MLVELSMIDVSVWSSVILTIYSLMIPFCWLVGGGDQERTKEVELTLAATSSSGGALGAEKRSHYHVTLHFTTVLYKARILTVCSLLVAITFKHLYIYIGCCNATVMLLKFISGIGLCQN